MKQKNLFLLLTLVAIIILRADNVLHLEKQKLIEIGKDKFILENITSVCEDKKRNIYILDRKSHQVKKISPDGKLFFQFGQKGEGPGDIKSPFQIFLSDDNNIITTERMSFASFFNRQGKFLKKVNFSSIIGLSYKLKYAGKDLFYLEKREKDDYLKQVIYNEKGKLVQQELFSIPPRGFKTRSGKRFLVIDETFSPVLFFSHYNKYSAAAVSNKYRIKIINNKGIIINTIERDIPAQKMNKDEIQYFEDDIKSSHFPKSAEREILKQLPHLKNFIQKISINDKYLFVFRVKKNILNKKEKIPVEIFLLSGKFLGTVYMEKFPVLISDKFIYFKTISEDDELLLSKYSFKIKL